METGVSAGAVLAVVPARGGSKGIPLKNLVKVRGRTLLSFVAEVAAFIPEIGHCVVSTDHEEIAKEASRCGLSAPFRRPEALSGDFVGDLDVLLHAIAESERLSGKKYPYVMMLQPTCPLRSPEHLRGCLRAMGDPEVGAAWTVSPVDLKFHPLKQFTRDQDKIRYFDEGGRRIIARQQLQPTYIRNGACYLWRRECLVEKKEFFPANTVPVITTEKLISIDTWDDVREVEQLMSAGREGAS
jgi:CMP-N,N'-diacetyllegionaminic acid synthase